MFELNIRLWIAIFLLLLYEIIIKLERNGGISFLLFGSRCICRRGNRAGIGRRNTLGVGCAEIVVLVLQQMQIRMLHGGVSIAIPFVMLIATGMCQLYAGRIAQLVFPVEGLSFPRIAQLCVSRVLEIDAVDLLFEPAAIRAAQPGVIDQFA